MGRPEAAAMYPGGEKDSGARPVREKDSGVRQVADQEQGGPWSAASKGLAPCEQVSFSGDLPFLSSTSPVSNQRYYLL
jgi:hypothetical protein